MKDEWETPQELFDELDKEFDFDLDPCCTYQNKKCAGYNTKEENGLRQPWYGNVFMNPPYSRGNIDKWVERAYNAIKNKECNLVVGLLRVDTSTNWFHNFIYNKAEIRFIKGRVKFSNSANSPPFASMIVIWRA